jgi:hypothetical protein
MPYRFRCRVQCHCLRARLLCSELDTALSDLSAQADERYRTRLQVCSPQLCTEGVPEVGQTSQPFRRLLRRHSNALDELDGALYKIHGLVLCGRRLDAKARFCSLDGSFDCYRPNFTDIGLQRSRDESHSNDNSLARRGGGGGVSHLSLAHAIPGRSPASVLASPRKHPTRPRPAERCSAARGTWTRICEPSPNDEKPCPPGCRLCSHPRSPWSEGGHQRL